ncbi:hypothetical protein GDO81_030049 [Engystomops pustulosus]|uniref:Uncharacterized protein n=1 Tax=Engystomops pustulosus TaxID=76066 RepID=A0AAV6YLL3_ENGPU|nr:hypothetical protein GDO81_030049 [Engystomops pustulosus]
MHFPPSAYTRVNRFFQVFVLKLGVSAYTRVYTVNNLTGKTQKYSMYTAHSHDVHPNSLFCTVPQVMPFEKENGLQQKSQKCGKVR